MYVSQHEKYLEHVRENVGRMYTIIIIIYAFLQ